MNDESVALKAWVLSVDGKAILTAVSGSEIHESVTPENRKMIGQALAEYLANDKDLARRALDSE